jgi:hypothetical protein
MFVKKELRNVAFYIFMVMTVEITVFWDVMMFSLINKYQTTWHHIPQNSNPQELRK